MSFRHLALGTCFIGIVIPTALPSVNWGQVRPTIDPAIPSYAPLEPISGKLNISGSDTMKPLVRAWVDDLAHRHPDLHLTVVAEGSETGLAALLEHRTKVAAMSRRITAPEIAEFVKEYGYEPSEVPVAGDALAVFVHKDNPVAGLSLDELDAMFCQERRRGLKYIVDSWGLVGVMDEWFEAPIRLYGRNGRSGTSFFFREEVCKGGTFHPRLVDAPGSASVVLDVGGDQYGIGFSAIAYRTSLVRPVPIASVKGGRYIEPSLQSVMDGSYPLRRNLYLYVAKPPKEPAPPASIELIQYALSRQGQQAVLDLGYFPLASEDLSRLRAKWSVPSTTGSTGDILSPRS